MVMLVEKKSKFFAFAYWVNSVEKCVEIIENLKKEHKKASHVCYAYKIEKPTFQTKFFDDKEPSGTAGRPILNIIEKKELQNVLVVVVRFFGGIKLGAGGLVRAYSNSAKLAICELCAEK